MPLSVYVCDDDYLVREGARAALSAVDDIEVRRTAQHGDALLAMVDEDPPDAVIVDIRMPPTHTTEGIEVAMRLRSSHPQIGIVVLSQHDDPAYALELLGDGSEGMAYLLKERLGDVDRLASAVRTVVAGGSVLDPKIVDTLLLAQGDDATGVRSLTPREHDVLALMAAGKGNAAIGRDLDIAERSVEKHVSAIFKKLGLKDEVDLNRRVAAVLVYLERGR